MKCKLFILFVMFIFSMSYAYEPSITKMVTGQDELNCKEVVFINGQTITLEGTLEVKSSKKSAKESEEYKYSLKDDLGNTLSRELKYTINSSEKANGQISKVWEVTDFSETIVVDGVTYTLEKYNFSKSRLDDVKPVGTYFAGNINLEKEYTTGTEGEVVRINGSGSLYGYDTAWATNETVDMVYTVTNIKLDKKWTGKYTTTTSATNKKTLAYVKNRPTEISFDGGFLMSENNISTLHYNSQMPEFYGDKALDYIVTDKGAFKYESFPVETRLPNYTLKGIKGHWGEMAIRQAFSLEYMDKWDDNTTPDTPVTRGEFCKIIAKALKINTKKDDKKTNENEIKPYRDVPNTNEYYEYIMELTKAGIVKGTGSNRFQPNAVISRAEAITMIINALGFENKAPEPLPLLNFTDNYDIPSWAEKFIYIGNKIGLINGDEKGNVMAKKQLTKAEIATITNNMIRYLLEELGEEYEL